MTTIDKPTSIIGLEVVGRGINLRPHQSYELKDILFKRKNNRPTIFCSRETGQTYSVPEGYEVNESPPMPAKQMLGQVIIEESWEHFDKRFGIDTSVTASNEVFSVDVQGGQTSQLRTEEEAFYAVRTSFIPYWTLYIPNVTAFLDKEEFQPDIPTPFKHEHRSQYEKFFEQYGTHYVKRAWIGGKAMLTFIITKSANMNKQDIRRSISVGYGGVAGGSLETSLTENKEALQKNSECTVLGQGGEPSKLGALSSLDETSYNEWLATVKQNPKVIELEAAGIWTLINDKDKATALLKAYKEATTFTPISAILSYDRKVFFIRGNRYTCYDIEKGETEKPKPLKEQWPGLSQIKGFERIDAAFNGDEMITSTGEDLSQKLFFFHKDKYIRWDVKTNTIDPDYPKRIVEEWVGVTFERIDAALSWGKYVYFFTGKEYIRYNLAANKADYDSPRSITERWAGITFDRIDATISWGNGKVYFFRGDEHTRYDMVNYCADPGYPKFIIGSYVEDWKFFD